MGTAVLHFGGLGFGSGFLMVVQYPIQEEDEFGRALFSWRVLDGDGETVGQGEELRDLDGGNHPFEVLATLMDRLIDFAETEVDALNSGFDCFTEDWIWELQNYIAPSLPIAAVRRAIECLDVA